MEVVIWRCKRYEPVTIEYYDEKHAAGRDGVEILPRPRRAGRLLFYRSAGSAPDHIMHGAGVDFFGGVHVASKGQWMKRGRPLKPHRHLSTQSRLAKW